MEPFQPLGGATAHPAGASECLKQGGSPPPSRHTPVAQRPTAPPPLPLPCLFKVTGGHLCGAAWWALQGTLLGVRTHESACEPRQASPLL